MRPYRGLTKEGKWVEGWYLEATAPSSNGDVVKSFIITKSWSVVYIDADGEYQFEAKCIVEVIPKTVGQSTGLHDKNGKEDYDGNIWEVEYRGKLHRFIHKSVLNWDGYGFEFECLSGSVSSVHANVSEDGVIIGTIHDKEKPE